MERLAEKWDARCPQISKSWRSKRLNLRKIFDCAEEIRKVMYTTNAIESLNSVIRKATRKRKVFPTDKSVLKIIYLATRAAT
jgi:transposase-like protein